jgi:hypothetical protein
MYLFLFLIELMTILLFLIELMTILLKVKKTHFFNI